MRTEFQSKEGREGGSLEKCEVLVSVTSGLSTRALGGSGEVRPELSTVGFVACELKGAGEYCEV